MKMKKYKLVEWPESQLLEMKEGFKSHAKLVNSPEGLNSFGSCAYLVDPEYYELFLNNELKDRNPMDDDNTEIEVTYDTNFNDWI
jgi:hypothetical protein